MLLDRRRSPAIGVPFPQNRIHRAAQHLGITLKGLPLLVSLGLIGVIGEIISFVLQLFDGAFKLGNGSTNVRQLDNIGLRLLAQLAQFGQVIGDFLLVRQMVREIRDNTAGQGDVPGVQLNAGILGKCLKNWKQRVSSQGGRLVNFRIDNLRCFSHVFLLRVSSSSPGDFELQRPNQSVAAQTRYASSDFWIARVVSWAWFIMQQERIESRENDWIMISMGCKRGTQVIVEDKHHARSRASISYLARTCLRT